MTHVEQSIELSPGPWRLVDNPGEANRWRILAPDPRGGTRWLMSIHHNGEELPEKQIANLRVAAAGPELLDAAQRAEWWLSTVPNSEAIRAVLRAAVEHAGGPR